MKLFLSLTAIIEGLTGFALVAAPNRVALLLMGVPFFGAAAMIVAFIAGAALISLAFFCWLTRKNTTDFATVKTMVVYNIAVAAVLVYGVINYQLTGILLWPAVCFHVAFAVWAILILKKSQPGKNIAIVQKKQPNKKS